MAAQFHVAGVLPDLWIEVVCAEIQKVSSHCSGALCSVNNVCSDGAEGSKDGGIDAAGKIQKRPEDLLEAGFVGCGKQMRIVNGCGQLWLARAIFRGRPSVRSFDKFWSNFCAVEPCPHFFNVTGY